MIFLLLIVPLIGVLLLLLEPSFSQYNVKSKSSQQATNINRPQPAFVHGFESADSKSKERIKRIALIASLINFFISIIVWFQFDPNSANYQFVSDFGSLVGSDSLNFCHFHVGIDGISLYFVLLTTFITPICILSN